MHIKIVVLDLKFYLVDPACRLLIQLKIKIY